MNNRYLAGSIIRLLVPIIIAAASALGFTLDADMVLNVVCAVAAVASGVYCWWWKNNPITEAAQTAQDVFGELKEAAKEEQE